MRAGGERGKNFSIVGKSFHLAIWYIVLGMVCGKLRDTVLGKPGVF